MPLHSNTEGIVYSAELATYEVWSLSGRFLVRCNMCATKTHYKMTEIQSVAGSLVHILYSWHQTEDSNLVFSDVCTLPYCIQGKRCLLLCH